MRIDRDLSTISAPKPLTRSSTSRNTRMLGHISRHRCLMSLHTSCPSGHACERNRWKHGDGRRPGRWANSSWLSGGSSTKRPPQ
eukprot:5288570-Prymnesium_polylepis.1